MGLVQAVCTKQSLDGLVSPCPGLSIPAAVTFVSVVGSQGAPPCHRAASLGLVRPLVGAVVPLLHRVPSWDSCWDPSAKSVSVWVLHLFS